MRDLSTMQTPDIPQSLSTGISSVVNERSQMSSGAERHISARISSEGSEDHTDMASEDSTDSSESDEETCGPALGDKGNHLVLTMCNTH